MRGIDRPFVRVLAENVKNLTRGLIAHHSRATQLNEHFVPNARADIGVQAALGDRELVAGFITFVIRRAVRTDRHVVVACETGVRNHATHGGEFRIRGIEFGHRAVFKRAVDDKAFTLGVASDLVALVFTRGSIGRRRAGVNRHVIPDG